jgi:hypothetical protein
VLVLTTYDADEWVLELDDLTRDEGQCSFCYGNRRRRTLL